ncbi:MAG: LL-diaminopimelate aminotransferase [Candidatus Tritonobacter lacicola]|nr:LL-diaminopimelate aminotransferase [Candidatus Tritonobacter lacicola]
MKPVLARRLNRLPPYLFAEIDRVKRALVAEGKDIIDLGVGDPDLPTPPNIVEALYRAARDPSNQKYALDYGMDELRAAIAAWYDRRFGVELDPDSEILPLIGSKEGIGHIPLAFIDPGDTALVPDPAYPVYNGGTIFAGGEPFRIPLLEKNGFIPDLAAIPAGAAAKAKLIFLNYPNNPTAATCGIDFFERLVDFARKNGIIVCHDAAYTELAFDGYRPPSFLQAEGAVEVGIEFHSLSKTYNMTGWRLGFAVGNADILKGLSTVKSNIDSGIFGAVQIAGVEALTGPQNYVDEHNRIYRERRDALVDGLNAMGWKVEKPKATFYVWAPVPDGYTSASLAKTLLERAAIVATPGSGLGSHGEGYIRFALTRSKERIREAVERMARIL